MYDHGENIMWYTWVKYDKSVYVLIKMINYESDMHDSVSVMTWLLMERKNICMKVGVSMVMTGLKCNKK